MKTLLKTSVYTLTIAGILGLGLSSALAATTTRSEDGVMYTTDGYVNWSRSVLDPMVNWSGTIQKEVTEDKADEVADAVKKVADNAQNMAAANAAYDKASAKAGEASEKLAALSDLEQKASDLFATIASDKPENERRAAAEKLLDEVGPELAEATDLSISTILDSVQEDPVAAARAQKQINDAIAGKIDQAKAELDAATTEVNKAIDTKNELNKNVLAQESILAQDQATAAKLLAEAGVTDVSRLDEAMADPAQRAALQQNLNDMYDTYWSNVPKIDLETKEGQDYAKTFLTALSGQSQAEAQQAHMVASETAGGKALAAYEERRAAEETTKRAQITERADDAIRAQEQRKAENQATTDVMNEYLGGKYVEMMGGQSIYTTIGNLNDQSISKDLKAAQQDRLAVDSAYDGAASAVIRGGTLLPNEGESQASYEARLSAWNGTMGDNYKSIYTEEGMTSYMNARDMSAKMDGQTYDAKSDAVLTQVGQTASGPVLGPTVGNAANLETQRQARQEQTISQLVDAYEKEQKVNTLQSQLTQAQSEADSIRSGNLYGTTAYDLGVRDSGTMVQTTVNQIQQEQLSSQLQQAQTEADKAKARVESSTGLTYKTEQVGPTVENAAKLDSQSDWRTQLETSSGQGSGWSVIGSGVGFGSGFYGSETQQTGGTSRGSSGFVGTEQLR